MTIEVYHQVKEMVLAFREPRCAIEGCSSPRQVRHLCENHYASLRRSGASFNGLPFIKPTASHLFIVDLMDAPSTDQCVMWPFSQTEGYGHFGFKSTTYRVHRIICFAANGRPPSEAHEAAHDCGTSLCCNPKHLVWKTHQENISDKERHGTLPLGEKHHQAKLSGPQVAEIRSLRGKVSRRELAVRYGVGRSTIDNVIDQTTWRHL